MHFHHTSMKNRSLCVFYYFTSVGGVYIDIFLYAIFDNICEPKFLENMASLYSRLKCTRKVIAFSPIGFLRKKSKNVVANLYKKM